MRALKERFDKAENYQKIIAEIAALERVKKTTKIRYLLVPVGLLASVLVVMLWHGNLNPAENYLGFQLEYYEEFVDPVEPSLPNYTPDLVADRIVINEGVGQSGSVRLMAEAVDWDDAREFSFIENLEIPTDLTNLTKWIFYVRQPYEYFTSREEFLNSSFDIRADYVLWFDNGEEFYQNLRQVRISFSENGPPMRDYFILIDREETATHDGLAVSVNAVPTSVINGVEVMIYRWEQIFIAQFVFDGLYFDVETSHINEAELIAVLESILRPNN